MGNGTPAAHQGHFAFGRNVPGCISADVSALLLHGQPITPKLSGRMWFAKDQCMVNFAHLLTLEVGLHHARQRFVSAYQNHPGSGLIETVQ